MIGIGGETRRQRIHDLRHEDQTEYHEASEPERHQRGHAFGQLLGDLRPLHREGAREGRHESGIEGALAKQAPKEVRQLQGDEEGVGKRAGAKHGGDQHVPGEAQNPADHGPAADGENPFQHSEVLAGGHGDVSPAGVQSITAQLPSPPPPPRSAA